MPDLIGLESSAKAAEMRLIHLPVLLLKMINAAPATLAASVNAVSASGHASGVTAAS